MQPVSLSELIQQVKRELLTPTPEEGADPVLLCVDSVELELQVIARREGQAGVKIDVLSVFRGEVGSGISRGDAHTIRVQLSPLFDKQQLVKWYKERHGRDYVETARQSVDGLLKGDDSNIGDSY